MKETAIHSDAESERVCPYCQCSLEAIEEEPDMVARCGHCGEITCSLCFDTHIKEKHPGYLLFGRIKEGKFIVSDDIVWDEKD